MDIYSSKEYIKQFQKYLYYLSLKNPYLPKIASDGIYGVQTSNAVAAYQRRNGLPVTGDADEVTWSRVKSDYDEMIQACSPPLPLAAFPGENYRITVGEKGDLVCIVQAVIRCLDAEYGFGDDVRITGCYSQTDADAVRSIQAAHGLPATGVIDVLTWNCMAKDYTAFCRESEYTK